MKEGILESGKNSICGCHIISEKGVTGMSKKKWFQKGLAIVAAVAMLLTGCQVEDSSSVLATQSGEQTQLQDVEATVYHAAERLADAAAHYNKVSAEDLLKVLPENTDVNAPVSRIEVLAMLSQAFGTLPDPGVFAIYAYPIDAEFDDVPSWAEKAVSNLSQAGLLTGTNVENTILSPDDKVSWEEIDTLIRRVYAYLGQDARDDFWSYINRDWLLSTNIPYGYGKTDPASLLSLNNVAAVAADIKNLAQTAEQWPEGSDERKIGDFYNSVMDEESRNQAGAGRMQPYLDRFNNAKSLDELLQSLYDLYKDTGISLLYDFTPVVDSHNSERYMLSFTYSEISLSKTALTDPDQRWLVNALGEYLKNLLLFGGLSEQDAEKKAQLLVDYNLEMAPLSWEVEEENDVDKIYNLYTFDDLQALFPNIDLEKMMEVQGYNTSEAKQEKIVVTNPKTMEYFASLCNEENLELLKATAISNLVGGLSTSFTTDLYIMANDFRNLYTGTTGTPTLEETANYLTRTMMSLEVNRYYAKTYCSAEIKEKVTGIIREIIDVFRKRIDKVDWMSQTTKENAKKKLDTMRLNVGYPDEWDDDFKDVPVYGAEKGKNNLLENTIEVSKRTAELYPEMLKETVDKDSWAGDLITVNAYYNPICNSITVPAGSLQAPFYSGENSLEENLAGIGFFIAHEVTHSFDDGGAKYDENGNAANWWTDEDYAAFQERCSKVAEFYDGYEAAPGFPNNGTRTLSENIADLGSAECLVEYLKEQEKYDLSEFFAALAWSWRALYLQTYLRYLANVDVHSYDCVRVNRTISAMDSFYETFNVKPGDGMYTPPEDRPKVW